MANEQLPPDAYGPINKDRPGNIDPFANFDNFIRYQDMLRYQTISQYAQSTITPQSLSWYQQRGIAHGAYQYGTGDDQAMRYYQRQREMSRIGTVGGVVSGAAAFAPVATVAMGGLITGLGISAVAAIPGIYIARGVDRTVERQKLMHSMALDLEQYRSNLGFNSALSYNDATRLSTRLLQGMGPGPGEGPLGGTGQFFNREQQLRIHKIALSNNMINARGYGADSGTMKQYERNFEELKKTTEDVVKLMQTTIEGGMAVIKNLQQSGFRTMRDVNAQIRQAKAFGGLTGLGTENMMQIGAAGAQAVQGTPYAASIGANMFQQGAAQAGLLARGSMAGQYLVDRVGGVAAAGAAIGRFHMNIFSSGMGTKLAAYMMNPDGSVNQDRLNRVTSGKVGVDEMLMGAGNRAYAMGANRAAFEEKKMMLYNDPTLKGWERDAMSMGLFNMWRANKPGNIETQAGTFAGLGTNDIREQQLVKNYLLGPKGYDRMLAASNLEDTMIRNKTLPIQPYGIKGFVGNVNRQLGAWGEDVAIDVMNAGNDFLKGVTQLAGTPFDRFATRAARGLGLVSPNRTTLFNWGSPGDMRTGLSRMYGLESTGDIVAGANLLYSGAGRGMKLLKHTPFYAGQQLDYGKMSTQGIDIAMSIMASALYNDKTKDLYYNTSLMDVIPGGRKSYFAQSLMKSPALTARIALEQFGFEKANAKISFDAARKEYDAMVLQEPGGIAKERQIMERARFENFVNDKYPTGIDGKRLRYLEAEKIYNKLNTLPDYHASAVQAGKNAIDVVNDHTKSIFYSHAQSASTAKEDSGIQIFGPNKTIEKVIRSVIPGFDATKPESVIGAIDYYAKLKSKISAGFGGTLTDVESKFVKALGVKDKEIAHVIRALDYVNIAQYQTYAAQRATNIIAAGERRGIEMSSAFRKDLVNVLAADKNVVDDKAAREFAIQNANLLSQLSGTASASYFTKDLTGRADLASRIMSDPGVAMAAKAAERSRKDKLIDELQAAILSGDTTRIRNLPESELYADEAKKKKIKIDKVEDAKRAYDILRNERLDESGAVTTDDRGNTRYANVNPPITNYWNNRWVL